MWLLGRLFPVLDSLLWLLSGSWSRGRSSGTGNWETGSHLMFWLWLPLWPWAKATVPGPWFLFGLCVLRVPKRVVISPASTYLLHWRQVCCCPHLSSFVAVICECAFPLPARDHSQHAVILFIFISLAPSTVPNSKRCLVTMCCVAGKGRPQGWLLWVHIFCLSSLWGHRQAHCWEWSGFSHI